MKAIRIEAFGGPEVLKLREVDDPRPGAGQVVVALKAAGVNPVETYVRSGAYAIKPQLPYTPGNDGAGIVAAVSPDVKHLHLGDRVYVASSLTGTYAEKTLCDATRVHPLPAATSFSEGAALGVPYGTAYRALFQRAKAQPSETVLVHGATGGVGTAAVQWAVAAGCRVIGTGGSAEGRLMIEGFGAALAVDHHDAGYVQKIMDFTAGNGVDVILEMLANVNLGKDLTMLARSGRVAVIGSRGAVEIDPRNTMAREADIRGVMLSGTTPKEHADIHAAIAAGLGNKTLKPVIDQELPLSQAPRAHEEVMKGNSRGKIVLLI
jgi:NADPH2:quinone reductase